jgi:myosin heavy subunit
LPIINGDQIDVDDMAATKDINEVDLLYNLKNRLNQDKTFTNVGPTLIIVNPFKEIKNVYGSEKIEYYAEKHKQENPETREKITEPHLYDLVLIAIREMLKKNPKNQALIVSGESGAGKTECAKLCMKFIAYYFGKKGEEGKKEESLEDKILACNPVLEAFGNAKTVRNDNSSRFGKYIKIFVKIETKQIVGAYMETYLLEKSRVVSLAPGERNYHIFYQVLVGLNELIKTNFDYNHIYEYCAKKRLKLSDATKNYIEKNLTEESIKKMFNMKQLKQIKYDDFNYLKTSSIVGTV